MRPMLRSRDPPGDPCTAAFRPMGNGAAHANQPHVPGNGRPDRPEPEGGNRSRSGARSRPTLLVNPPTDTRLRETLETMLDERAPAPGETPETRLEERAPAPPAELEAMVRPQYPRLVVRARSLEHESVVVWYVYREGYWVPASRDEPAGEAR